VRRRHRLVVCGVHTISVSQIRRRSKQNLDTSASHAKVLCPQSYRLGGGITVCRS
jgi:hypothetical protein